MDWDKAVERLNRLVHRIENFLERRLLTEAVFEHVRQFEQLVDDLLPAAVAAEVQVSDPDHRQVKHRFEQKVEHFWEQVVQLQVQAQKQQSIADPRVHNQYPEQSKETVSEKVLNLAESFLHNPLGMQHQINLSSCEKLFGFIGMEPFNEVAQGVRPFVYDSSAVQTGEPSSVESEFLYWIASFKLEPINFGHSAVIGYKFQNMPKIVKIIFTTNQLVKHCLKGSAWIYPFLNQLYKQFNLKKLTELVILLDGLVFGLSTEGQIVQFKKLISVTINEALFLQCCKYYLKRMIDSFVAQLNIYKLLKHQLQPNVLDTQGSLLQLMAEYFHISFISLCDQSNCPNSLQNVILSTCFSEYKLRSTQPNEHIAKKIKINLLKSKLSHMKAFIGQLETHWKTYQTLKKQNETIESKDLNLKQLFVIQVLELASVIAQMVNSLISQFFTDKWRKHMLLCQILVIVLQKESIDLTENNHEFNDTIVRYLEALLEMCVDTDVIDYVSVVLLHFPANVAEQFIAQQMSLCGKLLDQSPIAQSDLHHLKAHNLCHLLYQLTQHCDGNQLEQYRTISYQMTIDYLGKVLQRCPNLDTVTHATKVLHTTVSGAVDSFVIQQIDFALKMEISLSNHILHRNIFVMIKFLADVEKCEFAEQTTQRIVQFYSEYLLKCQYLSNVFSYMVAIRPVVQWINSLVLQKLHLTEQTTKGNLNIVYEWALIHMAESLPLQTKQQIFSYLIEQLDQVEQMDCILSILCFLKYFSTQRALYYDQFALVRTKLQIVIDYIQSKGQSNEIDIYVCSKCPQMALEYEVMIRANWWIQNCIETLGQPSASVFLSADLFAVFNLSNQFTTVCSSTGVSSGVCFYEVILLSDGMLQIGWKCREGQINGSHGVGDDQHSVGVDGFRNLIWHNAESSPTGWGRAQWKTGDVVGALVDFNQRKFAFYLNGHLAEQRSAVHFTSMAYYAAASLEHEQKCYFNFGQLPFKYPPDDLQYWSVHQIANITNRQCILLEACHFGDWLWFRYSLPTGDNQVLEIEPLYSDEKQQKFQKMIYDVLSYEETKDVRNFALWNARFADCSISRHMQALVGHLTRELRFTSENYVQVELQINNICVLFWGKVFQQMDESNPGSQASQINAQSCCTAMLCKVLEFIHPYTTLLLTGNVTAHRAVCAILSQILQAAFLEQNIKRELLDYFVRLLSGSIDKWLQLFVVICIAHLQLSPTELKEIESNDKIIRLLNDVINGSMFAQQRNNHFDQLLAREGNGRQLLHYRLYMSFSWFRDHVLTRQEQNGSTVDRNDPVLVPFIAGQVTLSPDLFCVRNDRNVGVPSVRSACAFKCAVCIYYEVLLLSGGRVLLGWATSNSNLKTKTLASDANSVAIDSTHRVVRHAGKCYKVNMIKPFKMGDVIGCLLDAKASEGKKLRFHFYHNGEPIAYEENGEDIFFSEQPYYAAASLYPNQQCYFNFGQSPFRYSPKGVDHLHFAKLADEDRIRIKEQTPYYDFSHTNWNQVIFANTGASIVARDVSMQMMLAPGANL